MLRFQAGESDVINRLGARNFGALEMARESARSTNLANVGANLEYSFLFFNLADPPAVLRAAGGASGGLSADQTFRQAVSAAIDRDSMVRTVYLGRAAALAGPVPPGNRYWINNRPTAGAGP